MEDAAIFDSARQALYVLLIISAPIMLVALTIGFVISLFQALTQMQEQTLAFVPKILLVFVALLVLMPFMYSTLHTFTEEIHDRIVQIGTGKG
jgi:flagellar biosynthetic protein FliQ